MITTETPPQVSAGASRPPVGRWSLFIGIGLLLYAGLYGWSEWLVRTHADANRFHFAAVVAPRQADFVILGASHAMPLDYDDTNAILEKETGATIVNLASEGAGILPNHLLLDYYLARGKAEAMVFVVDSFAFYSRQWNEDRFDSGMLQRAPLDGRLVSRLFAYPWARNLIPAYVSGFSKINNSRRFAPDISEGELKFDTTYRPIAQIDRQRLRFLYPEPPSEETFEHYLAAFEELVAFAKEKGMRVLAVKPPTPPRYRENIPDEAIFDARFTELVAKHDIVYADFSELLPDHEYYYDTDHLNRAGATAFIERGLTRFLVQ